LVQTFHPDFICYEKIILEIKAVSDLCDEHRAQILNYLSATTCSWVCSSISGITRELNTSASCPETANLPISSSENFASFRVFRGLKHLRGD
jgi:hypothetical protein